MRASDADRDRIIDMLREAVGDGRLTADEFDERLEAALSSRTLGELAALIADLGRPGLAPAQAEDVVLLDQRGGSVQRAGPWVVPRELDLRLSWCDVTLDFTDAVIARDTLLIDVNMRGGSLTLVTRPGIFVDAGDVVVRYADVDIQPSAEPGAPVLLRIRLTGRMRYGYIGTRQARPALPPDY
jgi:hypothetical protein